MFSVLLPTNSLLVAALSLLLTRLSSSSLSVPDIPHIAAYFGTKTRYEEVNPHLLRDLTSVNTSVLKPPPNERCSPVHLTAVIRHGSRYPTVKNIRRIQKLSELVRREASRGSGGPEDWLREIQSRWDMCVRERRCRGVAMVSGHPCVSSLQVLEYKSDLKQYWKRSHGHVISGLSSCPLFHHVFRTLDKAGRPRRSTEASPEPASILLGHAETLLPLLSLLGLYKDQTPPTANNYHAQHGRSFRSGRIVPYAANLLFVLYDCQRGPRLQLLINESPVRFPGLEAEDAPLYRDVRATYRHLLDGCDFNRESEFFPHSNLRIKA
uniref:Multiple inositol-polyphosphate phosphatase 1b n=1 Tax=Seriola lalandi dorsalis TaxID=1841481 RepID=A0A3B4XWR5_SERLL